MAAKIWGGGGEDCVNHLYGSCAAVNLATRQIRASLNLPNAPLSLALSVGADSERASDDLSVQDVFRGVTPFFIADAVTIALLVAFPSIVLWLPSLAS